VPNSPAIISPGFSSVLSYLLVKLLSPSIKGL
jgi:hypothetical protein